MTYDEFARRAATVYSEIPAAFKEGVDGLEVSRRTVLHPTLPDIFTLGECVSEHYPSEFGGAGEIRSIIHLYYGSFLELSRRDDEWDWEEEIFETITHELRHHLEHLASDDSLGEMDWVEDQNFARREGRPFDPLFYRGGRVLEPGYYEVDGDRFLEVERRGEGGRASRLSARVDDGLIEAHAPTTAADVHYLRVPDRSSEDSEFFLVLIEGSGLKSWLRRLLWRGRAEFVQGEADLISRTGSRTE